MLFCDQCKCTEPGCDRPQRLSLFCLKHGRQHGDWGAELKATKLAAEIGIINEIAPSDVEAFLAVAPRLNDPFWELVAAWIKHPVAIRALLEQAQKCPREYEAEAVVKALHEVVRHLHRSRAVDVDGVAADMASESTNLDRQGVGRFLGLLPCLQALRVLKPAPDPSGKCSGAAASSMSSGPARLRKRPASAFRSHSAGTSSPALNLGRSGRQYIMVVNTTVVSSVLATCRRYSPPLIREEGDLVTAAEKYKDMLHALPPSCGMRGSYVGPHLLRKHLLRLVEAAEAHAGGRGCPTERGQQCASPLQQQASVAAAAAPQSYDWEHHDG